MRRALSAAAVVVLFALVAPARADSWSDPRLGAWANSFRAGRPDVAIAAVEADLRSAKPHPMAATVWAHLMLYTGKLDAATARVAGDPALSRALGTVPQLTALRSGYPTLLARFDRKNLDLGNRAAAVAWMDAASSAAEHGPRFEVARALLARFPGDFEIVLHAWRACVNQAPERCRVLLDELLKDTALAASPSGKWLAAIGPINPEWIDMLVPLADYVKAHPRDPAAYRIIGDGRLALAQYAEATAAYEAAHERFPYDENVVVALARIQVHAGDFAGARQRISTWAAGQPAARRDATIAIDYARALLDDGERGLGREALVTATTKWPDRAEAFEQLGSLEGDAHPREALAAALSCHALEPARIACIERIVLALLADGRPDDALRKIDELEAMSAGRKANVQVGARLVWKRIQALERLGKKDALRAVTTGATRSFPGLGWTWWRLVAIQIDAKQYDDALKTLAIAMAAKPDATERTAVFAKLDAAKGPALVDKLLADYTRAHPEIAIAWRDRAGRIKGTSTAVVDAKLALWQEAQRAAPDRAFAWDGALAPLVEGERFDDALRLIDAWLAHVTAPSARADALSQRQWVWFRKNNVGKLTPAERKQWVADSDATKDLVWRGGYWRWRSELMMRTDDAAATDAMLERAAVELDSTDASIAIFNHARRDLTKGREYVLLDRLVSRDPDDAARIKWAMTAHGGYGGSKIVVLRLFAEAKRRGVAIDDLQWPAMAYKGLGAYDVAFKTRYLNGTEVSASDRYVDWYDEIRRSAEQPSALVALPFDPASVGNCPLARAAALVGAGSQTYAVICHPDGAISIREDHPITGKPVLVAEGTTWVRATYDSGGARLLRIADSARNRVDLTYDATGNLVALARGKDRIELVYGKSGKAETVTLVGVGSVKSSTGTVTDARGQPLDSYGKLARELRKRIGSTVDDMMRMIHSLETRADAVPELPFVDAALDKLRAKVGADRTPEHLFALAEYLVAHVDDRRDHAREAQRLLNDVYRSAIANKRPAVAVRSLARLDALFRRVRTNGLAKSEYLAWTEQLAWLAEEARSDKTAAALVARLAKAPHRLVPQARWLPHSSLENRGLWQRYAMAEVLPIAGARVQAVVVRARGDIVLGTTHGLAVQRAGFWEWFGFDTATGRWSPDVRPQTAPAQSSVRALAEDRDGTLWIGTGDGLMAISDYAGEVRRWRTRAEGLPAPSIGFLAAAGDGVVVGTDRGAARFTAKGATPIAGLETAAIAAIDRTPRDAADAPIVIGTTTGVFAITGTTATKLADQPVRALAHDPAGQVVAVRGREVVAADYRPGQPVGEWHPLPGAVDIVGAPTGVAPMTIDPATDAVAITTDQGLSLFRDEHVEHFLLPLGDRHPGVELAASRDARTVLVTTAGVYLYQLGQRTIVPGEVHDLLAAPEIGVVFVALGHSLAVVRQDQKRPVVQHLDNLRATRLARGPDGAVYVNSGSQIYRYTPANPRPEYLFAALPSRNDCLNRTTVRNLLVAKDGTLWVAAGSSVFHWHDGTRDEFNYLLDPDRFPVRSDCVTRVIETVAGKIRAIGSNEAFRRAPTGAWFAGGVAEFDGTRFVRPGNGKPDGWFASSYTRIDDTTAIVGTSGGFARDTSAGTSTFDGLKDPSYAKLKADHPALYLGTTGAELGGGLWLFGAAGGIVAYRDGRWFYPERLNWMLPDTGLADRGARAVHAVAVDANGRIYAGTDRGLLVYDAGGRDAAAFLISQGEPQAAFAEVAHRTLVEEAGVLLPKLAAGSEGRKLADRIGESRVELETLAAKVEQRASETLPTTAAGGDANPDVRASLEAALDKKRRAHHKLLAELRDTNRGLFQLVELDPLDLASLAGELADDVAVVQYLPARGKLYIQVVAKRSLELREVVVDQQELLDRTRLAARRLASSDTTRGLVLRRIAQDRQPPLVDELAWLYDRLLRPVEPLLTKAKRVYIVPSGSLAYLPFGALVRARTPEVEYAVQRYAFGYLSSMYVLDLMLRARPGRSEHVVVVADPDGSLPGARAEGKAVASAFPRTSLRVGTDATLATLTADAPKAGVLHLATHGVLDHDRPGNSFLLMANGVQLSVPDATILKLKQTQLVVLSACESGLGTNGLEYATLARAFMQAGASTVIATLWQVPDEPSRELMTRFYDAYADHRDPVVDLATAQRALLASGNAELARPQSWAGYVSFGGPVR